MKEQLAPGSIVVEPRDPPRETAGGRQPGDDTFDAGLRVRVIAPGSQAFPGVLPRTLVVLLSLRPQVRTAHLQLFGLLVVRIEQVRRVVLDHLFVHLGVIEVDVERELRCLKPQFGHNEQKTPQSARNVNRRGAT